VPKGGGDTTCTAPAKALDLLWSTALYFESETAIEKLIDIDAGAVPVGSTASPVNTFWVDDGNVWWLTLAGDLYRVDK
jgi:hypothetical protein